MKWRRKQKTKYIILSSYSSFHFILFTLVHTKIIQFHSLHFLQNKIFKNELKEFSLYKMEKKYNSMVWYGMVFTYTSKEGYNRSKYTTKRHNNNKKIKIITKHYDTDHIIGIINVQNDWWRWWMTAMTLNDSHTMMMMMTVLLLHHILFIYTWYTHARTIYKETCNTQHNKQIPARRTATQIQFLLYFNGIVCYLKLNQSRPFR